MLFDGILFVFWCSFIFLCSAHVLLSCPLCILEDVPNLEFMVCWPPAVLIVAHGFHVQYIDQVGDVRKECGHVLSSLIIFIWFYFDFYLFWFYHDFIYILSFFSSNFHPFHAPDVVQASHPKNIAWNLGRDNLKCSVSSHDLCHGLDFRMIFISFWFQYVWISMWFQSMDNI